MKDIFKYKYSILIFTLSLISVLGLYIFGLYKSLIDFENNDIDNYIAGVIDNLKDREYINSFLKDEKVSNKYEKDTSKLDSFVKVFKEGNITYLKVDNNVYELFANKNKIATLTLNEKKEENVLGLLTYTPYEVANITFDEGIYNLKIKANNSYKVYVNGVLLNSDIIKEKEAYKEFENINAKDYLPQIVCYEVNNLLNKPNIEIKDSNGKSVTYRIIDSVYNAYSPVKYNSYEEAKKYIKDNFDPLQLAKNWSLYLTADLNGRNGFYVLKPNLLNGTDLYKRAYNWSVLYDINFTSSHVLAKEPFTNVEMNNFNFYGDDFFTVDIKLRKNMILSNGVNKSDDLRETFYYSYIDGSYKLIDMKTIEDN